jgi:outer membrane protein assembly factor BamE (lipoprotein component of BamABCDE complex)
MLKAGWSVLLVLALAGCAAVKATQQPDKKNLEVLNSGTPRSHVIAELGAPLWSEERDGRTVDIFSFKQGYRKGVKASRALAHGAADVVTWGLWEVVGVPLESLADGKDVKVEITYDQQRMVSSVDVIQGQDVISPRPIFKRKSKPAATVATDTSGRTG